MVRFREDFLEASIPLPWVLREDPFLVLAYRILENLHTYVVKTTTLINYFKA